MVYITVYMEMQICLKNVGEQTKKAAIFTR